MTDIKKAPALKKIYDRLKKHNYGKIVAFSAGLLLGAGFGSGSFNEVFDDDDNFEQVMTDPPYPVADMPDSFALYSTSDLNGDGIVNQTDWAIYNLQRWTKWEIVDTYRVVFIGDIINADNPEESLKNAKLAFLSTPQVHYLGATHSDISMYYSKLATSIDIVSTVNSDSFRESMKNVIEQSPEYQEWQAFKNNPENIDCDTVEFSDGLQIPVEKIEDYFKFIGEVKGISFTKAFNLYGYETARQMDAYRDWNLEPRQAQQIDSQNMTQQ